MNFTEWNHGLLLSVVLVIVGGMLLVGASSLRQRLIAVGALAQAIVLAFVANGAFHGRSDLPLAAIVLLSLAGLWSLLVAHGGESENRSQESSEPGGVSPQTLHDRSPGADAARLTKHVSSTTEKPEER